MDKLLNDFQKIYHHEYHDEYKTMAHTCDELRHLILFIRRIVSSSSNDNSSDFNNPFSVMIDEFENNNKHMNVSRTSQMKNGFGRGTRRFNTSANNYSPIPSFSCRQIDPIVVSTAQVTSLMFIRFHFLLIFYFSYVYFVKNQLIIMLILCTN